jgi:hypothetical protein
VHHHPTAPQIAACLGLTDAGLVRLAHCASLARLDLGGCRRLTGARGALAAVAHGCPRLGELVLEDCPGVGDEALSTGVCRMRGLRSLSLAGCAGVTDAGVRALTAGAAAGPALLRVAAPLAVAAAPAGACQRRRSGSLLDALRPPAAAQPAGALVEADGGSSQWAWEAAVGQATGQHAQHALPCLESLSLRGAALTADGVRALTRLPALRRLALPFCPGLGADAMRVLEGARRLAHVDVSNCWMVTGTAVQRLQAAAPALECVR